MTLTATDANMTIHFINFVTDMSTEATVSNSSVTVSGVNSKYIVSVVWNPLDTFTVSNSTISIQNYKIGDKGCVMNRQRQNLVLENS